MLQALKEDPPLNTKFKDEFLVLSIIITPEKEARRYDGGLLPAASVS